MAAQLSTAAGAWSAQLIADVASIRIDDFVVTADRLDDCLDLIAIARPRSERRYR